MENQNGSSPDNSKLIVTALHKKIFERLNQSLADMARKKIIEGVPSNTMFGLILDLDDHVWRKHIEMGPYVSPPGPPNPLGTVKRAFCAVLRRSEIQHVIGILPAFESHLAEPPPLGHMHVLVLAAGMASPYTIQWGAELELEWD